jgi:hypothetical protein
VAAGVGAGQPRILGVLGDDPVERAHVLQGAPHQPPIGDAVSVVGEHPDTGRRARHQPELGQLGAGQLLAHGADRDHLGRAVAAAEGPEVLGRLGRVGHRAGVGHGQHCGEAATGRRPGPGGHRLGVLTTRFPQVGVQVDQTRQRDQPAGVDALDPCAGLGRVDEHAVTDEQVRATGAGEVGPADQETRGPRVRRPVHATTSRTRVIGISSAPPNSW